VRHAISVSPLRDEGHAAQTSRRPCADFFPRKKCARFRPALSDASPCKKILARFCLFLGHAEIFFTIGLTLFFFERASPLSAINE
jgi:hypothetical protein